VSRNLLRIWVDIDSFAESSRIKKLPKESGLRKEDFKIVREFPIDKGEIEEAKEWEFK